MDVHGGAPGGSSQMPRIKSDLAAVFGRAPLDVLDPDETVARGAAILGAMLNDNYNKCQTDCVPQIELVDVIPQDIGLAMISDGEQPEYHTTHFPGVPVAFRTVFPRFTTIPAEVEMDVDLNALPMPPLQDGCTSSRFSPVRVTSAVAGMLPDAAVSSSATRLHVFEGLSSNLDSNMSLGFVDVEREVCAAGAGIEGEGSSRVLRLLWRLDPNGVLELDVVSGAEKIDSRWFRQSCVTSKEVKALPEEWRPEDHLLTAMEPERAPGRRAPGKLSTGGNVAARRQLFCDALVDVEVFLESVHKVVLEGGNAVRVCWPFPVTPRGIQIQGFDVDFNYGQYTNKVDLRALLDDPPRMQHLQEVGMEEVFLITKNTIRELSQETELYVRVRVSTNHGAGPWSRLVHVAFQDLKDLQWAAEGFRNSVKRISRLFLKVFNQPYRKNQDFWVSKAKMTAVIKQLEAGASAKQLKPMANLKQVG
ncbi:hypothetical protein CYMTET_22666 [Cymbomonas tetramitiformis]|uniref:Uncharacterized protein n=1 Tax=Cymbomonas tetramitiformis TaxID=36881 RepID=A0AAE0FZS1_9CHLO|nr:hypothetical protein CYMTET_22666 [Cymbomonas tetramitiformis]